MGWLPIMGPSLQRLNLMYLKKVGVSECNILSFILQSKGKVNNAVKTIEQLFSKGHKISELEFLALLDWRNTPTERVGSSPALKIFRRRC